MRKCITSEKILSLHIKKKLMDYAKFFSDDVPSFLRSPVREIFRKVDLASIYSFAGGYPDAATFPIGEMEGLTRKVMEKYGAKALQYGGTQGVPELREAVSRWYAPLLYGPSGPGEIPLEHIQITTSSQQGIDVCSRIFLNPSDVVLTTNPAYLGALQSFRAYRAEVRELALDKPAGNAKFIYIVPDFCNPSGVTMSLEERQTLVEFARREDLLIIEDSPYRSLRYSGTDVPTIYSLAPERTLHLGSFSKIFAPGFRLGWIIAAPELLEQIFICKQALDLCPPVFDQYLAAEFIAGGALDRNLSRSIGLYREKRDYMLELLERYMPEGVSWTHPDGGLFLWLTLPEELDTVAMYDRALAAGVAYVAGSFFYPDGSHRNTMRINFSYLARERMEDGVKLLAEVIKSNLQGVQIFKMSGAGNKFVVLDGRGKDMDAFRDVDRIKSLCTEYRTDGLMILDEGVPEQKADFRMEFYNPDGSGGMMCGNGGRCISAFADRLGVKPLRKDHYEFIAPDGPHCSDILERPLKAEGTAIDGRWTVRLKMIDVNGISPVLGGYFLNTGTRHFVKFVEDVDAVNVEEEGKALRWNEAFAPEGSNANFVQVCDGFLKVRTFEKGVEGETLACGTGITASAIASWFAQTVDHSAENSLRSAFPADETGRVSIRLQARSGDMLSVDFLPAGPSAFRDIYLTGPAEFLGKTISL